MNSELENRVLHLLREKDADHEYAARLVEWSAAQGECVPVMLQRKIIWRAVHWTNKELEDTSLVLITALERVFSSDSLSRPAWRIGEIPLTKSHDVHPDLELLIDAADRAVDPDASGVSERALEYLVASLERSQTGAAKILQSRGNTVEKIVHCTITGILNHRLGAAALCLRACCRLSACVDPQDRIAWFFRPLAVGMFTKLQDDRIATLLALIHPGPFRAEFLSYVIELKNKERQRNERYAFLSVLKSPLVRLVVLLKLQPLASGQATPTRSMYLMYLIPLLFDVLELCDTQLKAAAEAPASSDDHRYLKAIIQGLKNLSKLVGEGKITSDPEFQTTAIQQLGSAIEMLEHHFDILDDSYSHDSL